MKLNHFFWGVFPLVLLYSSCSLHDVELPTPANISEELIHAARTTSDDSEELLLLDRKNILLLSGDIIAIEPVEHFNSDTLIIIAEDSFVENPNIKDIEIENLDAKSSDIE